ncbi:MULTISPECIES: hypothetical protein [Anaerosinus]|uniref:Uncharacterized protein n=1 Tax=Selenobaculum gibii TaxID=3054208 RepID=A0A9Y2AGH0_9FIRM|nr:hypothetical protein [Selenobaculum gbiensis]WIW69657.1 hypothetical protein P3F81_06925 [Selenobaculum gbiensis]
MVMYVINKNFFMKIGKIFIIIIILMILTCYVLSKLIGDTSIFQPDQYQIQDRKYQEPLRV